MSSEVVEWELNPMGYVIVRIPDEKGRVKSEHRCRRPKLREYRELRNSLEDITREANDKRQELTELQAKMEAEGADLEPLNKDLSEILDWLAERSVPWIKEAFEKLAENPLPEDEGDWPPWLVSQEIPIQMVRHWRSVPLASGKAGTNSP